MGYDDDLFVDPDRISSVLKCQICMNVLENPLVIKKCEHMFCDYCINDWLDRKRKCPICREEICIIRENDLATPPLYIRQMINELQVTCENCNAIMNMEAYLVHRKSCKADLSAGVNPDKAEIKKLQNKINCLEGQVASKTNEVKMVTQQRNQLSEEVKKLKLCLFLLFFFCIFR